ARRFSGARGADRMDGQDRIEGHAGPHFAGDAAFGDSITAGLFAALPAAASLTAIGRLDLSTAARAAAAAGTERGLRDGELRTGGGMRNASAEWTRFPGKSE